MACYLKCQYNEKCRSISYYPNTLTCKLYSTIDPGINNDSPNKHMYREGKNIENSQIIEYIYYCYFVSLDSNAI